MSFLLVAQSLDPFMDKEGETFIQVQFEGSDRFEQIALDTDLGRKVVRTHLCPLFPKGFATDRETRVALEVIQGVAFLKPRRQANANVDLEVARRPLARAVLAIARRGGTKKELSQLMAMLCRTAQREGIDIKKGPWPANEDALGKQLSLLTELMKKKGVDTLRLLVRKSGGVVGYALIPVIKAIDRGRMLTRDLVERTDIDPSGG